MKESNRNYVRKYFAAANTYKGFISYFDTVFDPEKFSRLYVLKGGPGTGKSSFMKKVARFFGEKNYRVEEIYCSSDPRSLDGVIIENQDKKIAIIDGTAPHERDAKIPGARDELIDLGVGWDKAWLMARGEEIIAIGKGKSDAYKAAYQYLALAGKSYEIIRSCYKTSFCKIKAKDKAECIFEDISSIDAPYVLTRLISSFGRFGDHQIDDAFDRNTKLITVRGDRYSVDLFLDCCYEALKCKNARFVHLPCALDPTVTDALYLPDNNIAIARSESGEIDADEFVTLPLTDQERIKKAKQLQRDSLDEAKRWFAIASDLHFRLEEIYGQAMNFEIIDQIIDEKITEIGNILENHT